MKRWIVALTVATTLTFASTVPVLAAADGSLPAAACNDGTMNAHSHVPATTGTGATTPAHERIPEMGTDGSCGHGD